MAVPTSVDTALATPDLIAAGIGYLGVIKFAHKVAAPDFRGEYRWGVSLLPLANRDLQWVDRYVQVHPAAGVEVTGRGAVYAEYSLIFEAPITEHFYIGWDEGAGFFVPAGGEPNGGGSVEFRSQLESGWKLDNGVRLAGWLGHVSNAHTNHTHFSGDSIGVYLQVPTTLVP